MADFLTTNDVVAALANTETYGGRLSYDCSSITTSSSNYNSLWAAAGKYGGTPTAPETTAATCVGTTVGSLGPLLDAPTGGTNRLLMWSHTIVNSGTTWLFDRLAHMGGLSGTSTGVQTVNLSIAEAAAAGRCAADGSDVEWFFEWYSATGSSAVTVTVTYTDQSDTSRTVAVSWSASMGINRLLPILANTVGVTSIKSIQSVQLSATTGTSGNFGLTAGKRLSGGTSYTNGWNYDFAACGFTKIGNGACLWLVFNAAASTSGACSGLIIVGGKA